MIHFVIGNHLIYLKPVTLSLLISPDEVSTRRNVARQTVVGRYVTDSLEELSVHKCLVRQFGLMDKRITLTYTSYRTLMM